MAEVNASANVSIVVRSALIFGTIWGAAEASLGFILHLLPIILPVPSLSGYILFPVGFLLMYSAFVACGSLAAMPLAAVFAAAVKLASLLLPGVSFVLVRNPTFAILAEGVVSFIALGLFTFTSAAKTVAVFIGISVTWRMIFLLSLLALGIKGGILAKGTGAVLVFLLVESAVNATLISTAVLLFPQERLSVFARRLVDMKPVFIALAGLAAVAAQLVLGTA
jgi:hypothetical protein